MLSVSGVPIRLHWSFFLILPYVAFGVATRFASFAEGQPLTIPPLAWGVLVAVLLFVSVVLHELGHVFVARARGASVRDVTLMMLGGVSRLEHPPKGPRDEATVAATGPFVSFALAIVGYALEAVVPGPPDLSFALRYLARINLALGVFNLLPAFPLDGGRVLRALLGARWNAAKSTRIAATVGKAFAILFAVVGVTSGNMLLALIAFFVWISGEGEARAAIAHERLHGLRVVDVAPVEAPMLAAAQTVEQAIEEMLDVRRSAMLVVRDDGEVGVVDLDRLGEVAMIDRRATHVGDVARFDLPVLSADLDAADALDELARSGTTALAVRGRRGVTLLTLEDLEVRLRLDALHPVHH